MGNYCYVASARRRARRWGAHGGEGEERGGGISRRHAHSLLSSESLLVAVRGLFFFSQFVHHEVEHKGVAVSAVSLFVWLTFRAITWKKYVR